MTQRAYNFTPGPSMLPLPVLRRIQEEWLDYNGMGASVIEISHLIPEFKALLFETEDLLRELLEAPANYKIAFIHGGGQMQFALVPLNLIALKPARKALYVETGLFATRAIAEGGKHATVEVIASSQDTNFDRIPAIDPAALDPAASYLHITTNNTVVGTQWRDFPRTGGLPLVGDLTSELLSRPIDVSRFGLLYAGAQKNLGVSGIAVIVVREDLLAHGSPMLPKMLNYTQLVRDRSLSNTVNTFAIYVANLMLKWVKASGGVRAMEANNQEKARLLYELLGRHEGFYHLHAQPGHRSVMNVTFRLNTPELEAAFIAEARAEGLYALKGHHEFGGIRASIYNAMPLEGVRALIDFSETFVRRHG